MSSPLAPETLSARLLTALGASSTPLDKVALSRKAGLSPDDRSLVRSALGELEEAGDIVRMGRDRWALPAQAGIFTGILRFRDSGSAWLQSPRPEQEEINVPAADTANALPGDRVQVKSGGTGNGRVVRIVERSPRPLVGTLKLVGKRLEIIPDDPRYPQRVILHPAAAKEAQPGDKVVVRLRDWKARSAPLEGEILESLGPANATGVDMLSIIRRFELSVEFSAAVLEEAERVPDRVIAADVAEREDRRGREIFTIDPDDAKDFDDAIEVDRLPHGGWRLGVHIADVAHYVMPGTALDREARRRGNSVYLADRVLPMLPERLSNGVCSLRPRVDRLVFSALLDFDEDGEMRHARFARSVIHSKRRFTYHEAFALLEGPRDADPFSGHLHQAWDLAARLRARRFREGSLDLDMPEIKVHVGEDGRPTRLERITHDRAHQLVEEFMLAANDAVAHTLKHAQIPTIYRIHEDPDPEKLRDYREVARSFGYKVGDLTTRGEIQKLLDRARGTPEEPAIKIGLLRSLRRAAYSADPLGHYGLAKVNYAHFTSPIRRYADLVLHRSLAHKLRLAKSAGVTSKDLRELSLHLSETERLAAEAERESVKLKKLEYFQDRAGKPETFEAVIMEVRDFGLMIELTEFGVGGRLYLKKMDDDYYVFDPVQRTLRGKKTQRTFEQGQRIPVLVGSVDLARQHVDFRLPGGKPARPNDTSRGPREQSKRRVESPRGSGPKRSGGSGKSGGGRKKPPAPAAKASGRAKRRP